MEDINEILKQAKEKFPVGCKFYPVKISNGSDDGEVYGVAYTQHQECHIYHSSDVGDMISGSANIYNPRTKTWAKLVEEVKKVIHYEIY